MKIWIDTGNNTLKVDFFCEHVAPANKVFLLSYKFDTSRWIIDNDGNPDKQTDLISEYNLASINYFMHGYFNFNSVKIEGLLACYINKIGMPGISSVFFPTDLENINFTTPGLHGERIKYDLIDLEGFNSARKLIQTEEFSIKEYIYRKLSNQYDEHGLSLNEETSLFSIVHDKFDPKDLMTTKGLRLFLEEQNK